ncbi:MarR family transcriptional regulator [Nonomuraea sp. NPDC059007]|uniref:GbsR/MarR family transcriptional regulator n=1 Tax=Nonomuraea sp. NPDC059007 TaxID=3346692 RepID=UPI0036ACA9CA
MPGDRLTRQDRQNIAAGLAAGLTYSTIAKGLRRPASTVTREILRNGGPAGYQAEQAHQATKQRARRRASARSAQSPVPPAAAAPGRAAEALRDFRERFAGRVGATGLPPMMSRVLACLYATDTGSLTSAELVRQLRVSPASISKAVNYLERQELIRRERDPRRRRDHYVIDEDVWHRALLASARVNAELADIAEQGAAILGAATPGGARLRDVSRFLGHINDDLVRSVNHWRRTADGPRKRARNQPVHHSRGQG